MSPGAAQQAFGLTTTTTTTTTAPDAGAGALMPSWGQYYRARRRASEHLIHGLTHRPSSSRAGVLLTDFALGAAIGAVAAVAAAGLVACAAAVVAGLTVDVVSGVVIDAAIRAAVACMRGGAALAARSVAGLLAGAARVRKVYASRSQKSEQMGASTVAPPVWSIRATPRPSRNPAAPRYIFGSTQARQQSTGLRPLRLVASVGGGGGGVRHAGGSLAAQRFSDWKRDKGVAVFATIALEQWKQRVSSRIRRRS